MYWWLPEVTVIGEVARTLIEPSPPISPLRKISPCITGFPSAHSPVPLEPPR